MPQTPESTDPNEWHRHFAMMCNNRAWELSVATRDAAEDTEMLDRAHAAAFHWSIIGSALNGMRAKTLLAEVHALLGFGKSALAYSQEVLEYFSENETDDWEIACVYAVHSHAAYAAGEIGVHRDSYAKARDAIDAIQSEQDRDIVLKTFEQVPAP